MLENAHSPVKSLNTAVYHVDIEALYVHYQELGNKMLFQILELERPPVETLKLFQGLYNSRHLQMVMHSVKMA